MELSCIHCGHPFTISQDQLGGHGQCPHCGGSIRLPRAEEENEDTVAKESTGWWQNSISGLISVVVHMCLLLILALLTSSILLPALIVAFHEFGSRITGSGSWLDYEESGTLSEEAVLDAVIE